MPDQKNRATRGQPLDLQAALRAEADALATHLPPALCNSIGGKEAAGKTPPIGLALSGGGIRSATFSLGVLQALAKHEKLASFDYMSTVSGGGYIGSWLSAWIFREGMRSVQEKLGNHKADNDSLASSEPDEVVWLRRYSNYLAPKVGFVSMDTLTLIATWLRNVFLNLLVVLGTFAILFMIPYFLLKVFREVSPYSELFGIPAAWGGLCVMFFIGYNLWQQGLPQNRRRNWVVSLQGVLATVIIPSVFVSVFSFIWWSNKIPTVADSVASGLYVASLLLLILLVWGVAELIRKRPWRVVCRESGILMLAGGVALVCGGCILTLFGNWIKLENRQSTEQDVVLVTLGVPMILAALGITTTIYTGLVGRVFYERSREWWSRLNAWLILIACSWAILFSFAFFSLPTLEWLLSHWIGWTGLLGTGWIGSLFASTFVSSKSTDPQRIYHIEKWLNIAASFFVIGLVFVTAAATAKALFLITYKLKEISDVLNDGVSDTVVDFLRRYSVAIDTLVWNNTRWSGLPLLEFMMLATLIAVMLFAWRVDVNKFSLHNMYKNRLIRCYLGASNQNARNEQPFVGLDDSDDIALHLLATAPDGGGKAPQLPLHIINSALNLTQGTNLAWQERKAASFVFTPLFCGYSLGRTQGDTSSSNKLSQTKPAYRPTNEFAAMDMEESGFTLGMALATSGAAISPNMGRASMPVLAFLLTIFNVRLGRWTANPAEQNWKLPGPKIGWFSLLQELLGFCNERSQFIYLSDGGHFDNLGVYELIRRRCAVILAVDASADHKRDMDDLADTIRKCRVDLGVEIHFDKLHEFRGDADARYEHGYIVGSVKYSATDCGTIILIKPSLVQDNRESADVLNYALKNPTFPHQTTADQFFDESQFESFRQLGKCIGEDCLASGMLDQLIPTREPPIFKVP